MIDTPPLWTASELAAALALPHQPSWDVIGSIQIDSRAIKPGDLFIALPGQHTDGNAYARDALQRGAAGALVTQPIDDPRCVQVADSEAALWQLGVAGRARLMGRVVAVTGSVGKTTTKEMLRLILRAVATEGNLNNHLGLPLTLARLPRETATAVVELGMNHAGELTRLTALARPHVAAITTVAAVHLEHFPNIEGIAAAKAEIYTGLTPDGVAVLPLDSPYRDILRAAIPGNCLTFGEHPEAACRLLSTTPTPEGLRITVRFGAEEGAVTLASFNTASAHCALAAIATAAACGVPVTAACDALSAWSPPAGRGAAVALPWPPHNPTGTLTLMDDSYNASPVAVAAALETLARLPGVARRVAVLGDMLELGPNGVALHANLAETIRRLPIARVHLAGPLMQHLYDALPPDRRGVWAPTSAELAPQVLAGLCAGDAVLVKGSAGTAMKTVVAAIRTA
jgi:UDP-N-acetylmuramoyl-tripeptide--D-alanyl-D-alanine ligase